MLWTFCKIRSTSKYFEVTYSGFIQTMQNVLELLKSQLTCSTVSTKNFLVHVCVTDLNLSETVFWKELESLLHAKFVVRRAVALSTFDALNIFLHIVEPWNLFSFSSTTAKLYIWDLWTAHIDAN